MNARSRRSRFDPTAIDLRSGSPTRLPLRGAVGGALALAAAIAGCDVSSPEPEPLPRGDGPSLVVVMVVDQARAEYLVRFDDLFTGGLRRLLDSGAFFLDAHQDHAGTTTAPGHASIATGMHPGHSGIVGNEWYDKGLGSLVYSARRDGVTGPANLLVSGLGDWLKAADPRSKVFTVSGKDRSAVMLGGHSADAAIWYGQRTGHWVTSEAYGREPEWLSAFNAEGRLDRLFGEVWEPLPLDGVDLAEYDVGVIDTGLRDTGFPHAIGGRTLEPDSRFYASIYDTPFVDSYLVELAIEIVDAEQLGADGSIDLLGLSFSALDTVGHDHGPNSPEVVDVLLRLDRSLGDLLAHLDAAVGAEHYIVAVSADHGVATMPEYTRQAGGAAARVDAEYTRCVQQAGRRLEATFGEGDWTLRGLYLNDATILDKELDPAVVQQALAEELVQCNGVARVWTRAEILAEWQEDDPGLERVRNSFHPERSPDVLVQHEPWYLVQSGWGTTHGSLYPHDSAVPLIISGPGIAASRIAERIRTVDLAPTLASLLGIAAPEDLDGMDKSALLRW